MQRAACTGFSIFISNEGVSIAFMTFLYRRSPCTIDSICRNTNSPAWPGLRPKINQREQVMYAHVMPKERHSVSAPRPAGKSLRSTALLFLLLTVSIAVNGMIILAAGDGHDRNVPRAVGELREAKR